ncbi:LTA synthase family protein [Zhongshania guokunii]|uniref:LTA synthase family protein n=1 Tax=Zhongshania guokunii TaxID=641783 RepID=A0ABV3U3M4_9GAMM
MIFRIALLLSLIGTSFFSYFGFLNPNPLGLLSDCMVFTLGLAMAYLLIPFGRVTFALYLIGFTCFSFLICVSNWWYFQYFQSFYNYESLGLGGDIVAALKSLESFQYKCESIYLFIFNCFFVALSIFFYRKPARRGAPAFVTGLVLLLVAMVLNFVANFTLESYAKLNISILKPSYVHPLHAFFVSDYANSGIESEEVLASDMFTSLNLPVKDRGAVLFKQQAYNVIYIVLESTRASLVGEYGNGDKLTPNIDALAKTLIVSKNFYANSNYTIKGEVASWCGIFDHNATPPISKSSDAIKNLHCLPKILAERGYDTSYFHGNTASFNSRNEFLPVVGFQNMYFPEDGGMGGRLPKIGWGISDEYMYQFMLDTLLSKGDKPFFAHFMTVSSHYPYAWDWGISVPVAEHANPKNASEVYGNYKNAVFYEDYALGKFWTAFKKSKLYDNTIVVITADHGVWVFDDEENKSLLQKNEEFFRVPLLIYHPDIKEPVELTDTASQIDLPETVLNMLGVKDYDDFFVGKNLFETVENPWAIMMKQGDIVVRKNDTICYVEGAGCAGIQQDCVAIEYGELLPDINKLQRCQKVTGNLLQKNGAVLSAQPADPDLMDKAFSLIRYHNKKVFMD